MSYDDDFQTDDDLFDAPLWDEHGLTETAFEDGLLGNSDLAHRVQSARSEAHWA